MGEVFFVWWSLVGGDGWSVVCGVFVLVCCFLGGGVGVWVVLVVVGGVGCWG